MDISLEQLTIGITHAVYRNTEIEDYHSNGRVMDKTLYKNTYTIVKRNISKLIDAKDLMKEVLEKGITRPEEYTHITLQGCRLLMDILFGIQCGSNWDPPHEIDILPEGDPAKYLLNGVFINLCDGEHIFGDSVMKTINQDITNRILMILKYLILR